MANYLEGHILDESSRLWYGARWQSGLGNICLGYNTYTSNSQERMWRTLKGILPNGGRNLDLGDLVHKTAELLMTWDRAGQFKDVVFKLEVPLPAHLSRKGAELVSEPSADPNGRQHRRLSAQCISLWLEEHGAEQTYLKHEFDNARVLVDGRTRSVYVLPKYQPRQGTSRRDVG